MFYNKKWYKSWVFLPRREVGGNFLHEGMVGEHGEGTGHCVAKKQGRVRSTDLKWA